MHKTFIKESFIKYLNIKINLKMKHSIRKAIELMVMSDFQIMPLTPYLYFCETDVTEISSRYIIGPTNGKINVSNQDGNVRWAEGVTMQLSIDYNHNGKGKVYFYEIHKRNETMPREKYSLVSIKDFLQISINEIEGLMAERFRN